MKILAISHEYPPIGGGGANACRHLCREYARAGHTVTIITAKYHDDPSDETVEGVRVIRVKARREKKDSSTFREMLSYLISAYGMADRICGKEVFDVCQVFFGIPSGPIALHLKRKYGIHYVIRFGGGDIPGAQKRFSFAYKVLSPMIRRIWKNADCLVANSEVLKNRAQAFEAGYPIRIITNGVDSEAYSRKKEISDYNEIRMLFVSRLIEGKGLQYIIPRMKEINDRVGKIVSLSIVGDGPYRNELEALIDDTNSGCVSFAGRKEGTELLQYYEAANLFMFPSLSEGMPNVVLEAMSMGLPVAMTDCGGSKELIRDNGFAAPIEVFVDHLVDLCKNDELLFQYGRNSRLYAEKEFSWRAKAGEYLEVFNG